MIAHTAGQAVRALAKKTMLWLLLGLSLGTRVLTNAAVRLP